MEDRKGQHPYRHLQGSRSEGIKFYYGASHSRMIERFRLAVENNTDDYIHVKDGTMVIRLMDCIFRSANTSALVEV